MAPVITQDATELMDDSLFPMVVNFDEISSLATSIEYDNTKLREDNGLDLFQIEGGPAVLVMPVNPEPQPVADECTIYSDPQPASPGPELLLLQAASPQPQYEVENCLIDLDAQPASPDLEVLQPAVPESSLQQILAPEPVLQLDVLDLPSVKVETRVETPPSPKFTADTSALSPSPVCKEEPASPAFQEAADAPKRRGRKRKYPEGMAPSRRRSTRPKVYLMDPLPDEELEKKRRNAVNAKKHRDMQKAQKQQLADDLIEAKKERDRLQQVVNRYKKRELQLLQMLNRSGIKVEALRPSLDVL